MTTRNGDDGWAYELVTRTLASHLGVAPSAIRPEQRLQEDLGVDSLDVIEVLLRIEDETGLKVAFDGVSVLDRIGTVAGAARLLATTSTERSGVDAVIGP